jgi:lipopolysaccharide/colanic/teichoic acid biosynthesis glycosyltransferase
MSLVAILVRLQIGSPVLFRQRRIGLRERPFQLVKFRTMSDGRDITGQLLPDHERLNAFGKLLRSTSLDELPELLNVLRGDMSLVGPRPLLPEYLERYSAHHRRRHLVRPGLTGLAQINGRNNLTWSARFDLDVQYVEQASLWLDFRIMIATVWTIITRSGIHATGLATMHPFTGYDPVEPPRVPHEDGQ